MQREESEEDIETEKTNRERERERERQIEERINKSLITVSKRKQLHIGKRLAERGKRKGDTI